MTETQEIEEAGELEGTSETGLIKEGDRWTFRYGMPTKTTKKTTKTSRMRKIMTLPMVTNKEIFVTTMESFEWLKATKDRRHKGKSITTTR